uniref:Cyclin L1a n=1 Tax=Eptatretus burgeri TaxID=7764 RepID=A0A8C4QY69_EPTBU
MRLGGVCRRYFSHRRIWRQAEAVHYFLSPSARTRSGKMAVQGEGSGFLVGDRVYSSVTISLENCIIPDEKLSTTPSLLDGLDLETETDLRAIGCELIQSAGILLKLPQVAMASGQVLFHRFFYSKSFVKHNMEVVAMACVNLASKIEEAPRRNRDIINVFHHLRQLRSKRPPSPLVLDQNYINTKNQLIKAERRVLKELGFCVHVKHPHKIIFMYLQMLECEKNRPLVQTAWNYMNDCLRSNVFVRFSPETIACACIFLAARTLEIPLPNRPHWFLVFGTAEESIHEICLCILRLYNRPKVNVDELESKVERCRMALQEAKLKAREVLMDGTPALGTPAGFSPCSKPSSPKEVKDGASGPSLASALALKAAKKKLEEDAEGEKSLRVTPHNGQRKEEVGGRTSSHSRSHSPRRHEKKQHSRSASYSSRSRSRSDSPPQRKRRRPHHHHHHYRQAQQSMATNTNHHHHHHHHHHSATTSPKRKPRAYEEPGVGERGHARSRHSASRSRSPPGGRRMKPGSGEHECERRDRDKERSSDNGRAKRERSRSYERSRKHEGGRHRR